MNSCVNSRFIEFNLIWTRSTENSFFYSQCFHIFHSLILVCIFTISHPSNIVRSRFDISNNHGRIFGISGTNIPETLPYKYVQRKRFRYIHQNIKSENTDIQAICRKYISCVIFYFAEYIKMKQT